MPLEEWHIPYEPRLPRRIAWLTVGFGMLALGLWMLSGFGGLWIWTAKLMLIGAGGLWTLVPRAGRRGWAAFKPVSRDWRDWVYRWAGAGFLIAGLGATRIAGEFSGLENRYWMSGAGIIAIGAGITFRHLRTAPRRMERK